MKPVIEPVSDRGEPIGLMEPMLISEGSKERAALADMSLELAKKSAGFCGSLPPRMLNSLADLVRSMNCYYSNLIEGHDTHPIEIEKALKEDYSKDPKKRDLQLEAKAHIAVQQWIDEGNLKGRAFLRDSICEVHQRFYEAVPDHLKWATNPDTGKKLPVIPGQFRDSDVKVGNHVAISPGAVPRFLTRFEEAYSRLGTSEAILATAAAHHRLAWIHPFLDGNGRVGRLISHAIFWETLNTGSVWSIARGLARSVETYKTLLANCDNPRQGDRDGRGNLSERALVEFTNYFLKTCIDQVSFMENLVQPNELRARILVWAEEQIRLGSLLPKSDTLLQALLYRGELPRGDVPDLLGVKERQAGRVVSALLEKGAIISPSSRAPLSLAFTAELAPRWLPGLFPDKPANA